MRLLFGSRHWERLIPDIGHTFLTAGFGSNGPTRAVAARANDGPWGAVYVPTARTITLDLSGFSGPVRAHWYDPTSGAMSAVAGSPLANTGNLMIATPGVNGTGTSDWVLVFDVI